jgi:predicted branched-subunit amino acid permease
LSNVVTGMATAWLATGFVDPAWHMPAGMIAGMLAGMGLSLILMPVFVALFGAMEVMLPVMLTAMLAGMLLGMAGTVRVFEPWEALVAGGLIGILTLLSTYALDADLRRRGR